MPESIYNILDNDSTPQWKRNLARTIRFISNLGIKDNYPESLKRNIVLTNQIGFVLAIQAFLISVVILLFLPTNAFVISWILALQVLVGGTLVANYYGKINFSRQLLSLGLPIVIVVSTIHSRIMFPEHVHESSYFIPRYYLLGVSIVPLLIFNFKEKFNLTLSLGVQFGLILFYNTLHKLFHADPESMGKPIMQDGFISISAAFGTAIITAGCLFLIRQNFQYEKRISLLLDDARSKNQKIQDSIRYALRLQSAIFPAKSVLMNYAQEFFLYYKPKDIVSGDFYIFIEKPNYLMMGVIDCTGHGVPGAFMSIIANNAIKRAINEFDLVEPKDIILKSAEFVMHEFGKDSDNNIYDGMDMSFCTIDVANRKILFAGANQTLYLSREGNLSQFKGSKNAPGFNFQLEKGLGQIELDYKTNDTIYMTSDGIQDQFGGERDKKFGKKRLETMIVEVAHLAMRDQCREIESQMNNWMNNTEQTDDICMIGYRFS